GRTSFLRLDVPSPASAVDRIDLADEAGVMGRADTFVDAEEELQPMIRRLLGRHWLVDTLATAIRLANGPGRGLNFVTAAGEAVLADGTLTVGPRQSIAGLLSRRSELRALREQIEEMERAAVDARRDCEELERRILNAEGGLQKLAARQAAAANAHHRARLQAAPITDKLDQLAARIASLASARQAAAQQLQELASRRDGSIERTSALLLQIEQGRGAIDASSSRQAEFAAAVE